MEVKPQFEDHEHYCSSDIVALPRDRAVCRDEYISSPNLMGKMLTEHVEHPCAD
jgi:hypothetical protein